MIIIGQQAIIRYVCVGVQLILIGPVQCTVHEELCIVLSFSVIFISVCCVTVCVCVCVCVCLRVLACTCAHQVNPATIMAMTTARKMKATAAAATSPPIL